MIVQPITPFPTTIAASGNWQSGYISFNDLNIVSASVNSTQAGAITIQAYLDNEGNIPIGTAASATISAGTVATVSLVNSTQAATTCQVEITNTGVTTATISDTAIVMQHT